MTTATGPWVDLEGTANTRDLGGIPVAGGGRTRRHRLLRSDSLQDLTPGDVSHLVDRVGLRTVVDLRTGSERASEGPGPLSAVRSVRHLHLSLIPESPAVAHDPGVVLPDRWADGATGAYLHYLNDAPQNLAAAVRALAATDGAVLVHCAAGKDRTGVLSAVVLEAVGASRADAIADYALTNERIERIFDRLAAARTYSADARRIGMDAHRVDAAAMTAVLDVLDERWGGATGYLRAAGNSDEDLAALRTWLVEQDGPDISR